MIHKQVTVTAQAAVLALGLIACTPSAGAPNPTPLVAPTPTVSQQAMTAVRLGLAAPGAGGGNVAGTGEYLAQAQGYFADEGLSIDFVAVNAGNSLAPLITGQLDVAVDGLGSGFFSAIQQGVDIRIVGPAARSEPNASGSLFVVRKDLVDGGRVRGYADLKGLKIAIPAHANSGEYAVAKAMQAGGLTLADADLVVMDFPAMLAALASKAIDVAGAMPEPLATAAEQNGSGVKWGQTADVVPGSGTVVVFSSQFAAQHDTAIRWMIAYLRGVRDYNDAFVKNLHRQQTTDMLAGALAIAPGLFSSMSLPYMDPNARVNVAGVQAQMDWYVQMGYLSAPVDLSKLIDTSFATAAVAQLGSYQ